MAAFLIAHNTHLVANVSHGMVLLPCVISGLHASMCAVEERAVSTVLAPATLVTAYCIPVSYQEP
jgi:hypothetical protein